MNRAEVEKCILQLLRDCALNGSTRDIDIDEPMGEAGLGLDSLSLMQFLVSLEKTYSVQLPVDFWSDAAQRSLRQCADLVLAISPNPGAEA